jgi:hypothetical protein
MKRLALAVASLVALLGTFTVAQAASLTLSAGTLQTAHVEASPEIPDDPEPTLVEFWIVHRVYSGDSSQINREDTYGPYRVSEGSEYRLDWTGETTPCLESTPEPNGGVGESFTVVDGESRYVCSRTNQNEGAPLVSVDGEVVTPRE